VAPPVKDNRIKYVKKKSPKAHSIKLIVKDERKDKVHSEKVKSFIGKIYAKQLKEFGHKISNSSTNQVIVYIKSYSIALSGSICTTNAKFRYSYSYGKRMTSNHDIEDSESSVPCFSNEKKYESTEKLMNILMKDFAEWFIKNNEVAKTL
jgi:hypothetical protein